ncbi:hypothetical protein [Streptomyces sp. Adlamb9]|uniref:hypothetical protein n=1 Tax=Streptomyces sp. Adlamb9 TaxID=3400629 RepID=UPI003F1C98B2
MPVRVSVFSRLATRAPSAAAVALFVEVSGEQGPHLGVVGEKVVVEVLGHLWAVRLNSREAAPDQ